jgi:dipeptidyl aminopeptidase/acylaminoacyl peptidase
VASAIDHLASLVVDGIELDLSRVTVAGHSAGGHLALWLAARNKPASIFPPIRVQPFAAAGLAAITDLSLACELNAGNGAVKELLGGRADEYRERYAAASPIELLPIGARQLIVHGVKDAAVPIDLSRKFVAAAKASGDRVEFVELPESGHMDYLDPLSDAHATLCGWLARQASTD